MIFDTIKTIWHKIIGFITKTEKLSISLDKTNTVLELEGEKNNCGLTALSRVMPSLTAEKIRDAFDNCCNKWPKAGVTHKEFNVVLRYLKIHQHFEYKEYPPKKVHYSEFIQKKGVYILLICGHFTVSYKGDIFDSNGYSNLDSNTKVYCSWLFTG